jgi:hypothetical protein
VTLEDYRWFLTEDIERYHKSIHRTLSISPMAAWERGRKQGRGLASSVFP